MYLLLHMFLILIFPLSQWRDIAMTTNLFIWYILYGTDHIFIHCFFYFPLENISNPFFHAAKCYLQLFLNYDLVVGTRDTPRTKFDRDLDKNARRINFHTEGIIIYTDHVLGTGWFHRVNKVYKIRLNCLVTKRPTSDLLDFCPTLHMLKPMAIL